MSGSLTDARAPGGAQENDRLDGWQKSLPVTAGGKTVTAGWKPPTPAPAPSSGPSFVSLKGSEVFHREDCATLKRAKTKERTVYPSRAAAARERRPAEDCKP